MIPTLTLILIFACVLILFQQLLIIRQIGILHARLGPKLEAIDVPSQTNIVALEYAGGGRRVLAEFTATAILILTTSCHICRPLLKKIGRADLPGDLSIGLADSTGENLQETCRHFELPIDWTFSGGELRQSLAVMEMPALILLDAQGKVLRRVFVDSLASLRRELTGSDRLQLMSKD